MEMRQNYLTVTKEKEKVCCDLTLMEKSMKDLAVENSELDLKYQKLNDQLEESQHKESHLYSELNLAKQQLQEAIFDKEKLVYSFEECRQEMKKMTVHKEGLASALEHAEVHSNEVERENAGLLAILDEKEQLRKVSLLKQAELEELACKEAEQTSALKESLRHLEGVANENELLLSQLTEQLQNMGNEKAVLCNDLIQTRTEVEKLQHENAELKGSLLYLEESGTRNESCILQLEEELRKMESQNSQLDSDLKQTRIELQNVKDSNFELKNFLGDYRNTFVGMEEEKGKLLVDLQSLKEAKGELIFELQESKHQMCKNKEDADELLRKFMETKEQLNVVTNEKVSLVSRLEESQKQMEGEWLQHANELEASCAHAQDLETEKQMLLLTIEDLQVQDKTAAEEALLLKGQIEDLRHQLQEGLSSRAGLSSARETSRQQIMELSSKLTDLSSQINDNSKEKQDLEFKLETLQKHIEEERLQNSGEIESLSSHLLELETERQTLLGSSENLDLRLKDLTEEIVVLHSQIESLRQQQQELSDHKAVLLSTLETSREQILELTTNLAETSDQLRNVRNENGILVGQLEALEKQIEEQKLHHESEVETMNVQSQSLESERELPSESSEISKLQSEDIVEERVLGHSQIQDVRELVTVPDDRASLLCALDISKQELMDLSSKFAEMKDELETVTREKKVLISELEALQLELKVDRILETSEIEAKHMHVQKLEPENQLLLGSLEASSLQERDMAEESMNLHGQVKDLRQKLQEMSDGRANLFTALETSRVQLLNLEEEKSTSLKKTEQLLQDSNEQKFHLLMKLEAINQDMLTLNANFMHVTQELECCRQLADERNMEKKRLAEELESSLLGLKLLTTQKESLLFELDGSKEQLRSLRSEKDDAFEKVEKLKSRVLMEEEENGHLQCESRHLQSQVQALEEEIVKLKSEMSLLEQDLQVSRQDNLHLEGQLQSVSGVLIQQSVETEVTKAQLTADLELSRESLRELASRSAAETAELLAQIKELQRDARDQNIKDADQVLQLRAHLDAYAKASCDVLPTDSGRVAVSNKLDSSNQLASGVAKLVKVFEERASSSGNDPHASDSEQSSHVSAIGPLPSETVAGKVMAGDLLLKSEHVLRADLESALQRLHQVENERGELVLALSRLEVFAASQLQLNKELTDKVVLLTKEHHRCVQASSHQTPLQIGSQNSCETMQNMALEKAGKVGSLNNEALNQGLTDKVGLLDNGIDSLDEQARHDTDAKTGWIKMLKMKAADSAALQSLNRVQLEQILFTVNQYLSERLQMLDRVCDNLVNELGHLSTDRTEKNSGTFSLSEPHVKWKKVTELAHCTCYNTKILLEHIEYLQTFYSQYMTQFQRAENENAIVQAHSKQLKDEADADKKEKMMLASNLQELSERCSTLLEEFFQHYAHLASMMGGSMLWKEQSNFITENLGKLKDRCTTINNQISESKAENSALQSDISGLQGQTAELIFFLDEVVQQNQQFQLLTKGIQDEFTSLQQRREVSDESCGQHGGSVGWHEDEPKHSSLQVTQVISCNKEGAPFPAEVRSHDEIEDVGQSHQNVDVETILKLLDAIHESIKGESARLHPDSLISKYLEASMPALCEKYKAVIFDIDELMARLAFSAKDHGPSSIEMLRLTPSEHMTVQYMTDKRNFEEVELASVGEKLEKAASMTSDDCNTEDLLKQLKNLTDDLNLAITEKANLEFELNQMEQKLLSTREKLNLAISKGKGLVQQRDGLKHALMVKSEEFDSLKASYEKEMQAKDVSLQEMELELRKSEKAVEDGKALQAEQSLASTIHKHLENILAGITLPLELTDKDLTYRLDWLVNSYLKFQDLVTSAEQNLHRSEIAVNILNAELQESQDKMNILAEALAKQQQENELLLNKLQNISEELSNATEKSAHEKALLQTDADVLKKRFDEQALALENIKETYASLCSALDTLLEKLQTFHFEKFGEKTESGHCTDPVSRLEACIHMLLDKHKLTTEEFDELTQRTTAIVAETEQQRKEREANEQKQQQLMEKLALKDLELLDFSRKWEEAAMTMAYQEDEIQGFQLKLQRVREELHSASDERDRFQLESSETEQKLLSLKEKLSLAVKKGKGLAQQRDSLKQALVEKTAEIDLLVATYKKDIQEKDTLLDEYSTKIRNLAAYEVQSAKLEKELGLIKAVLVHIEHVFDDVDIPATFQLKNLVQKVQWVVQEQGKAQDELAVARKDIAKYKDSAASLTLELKDFQVRANLDASKYEEANNAHILTAKRFEEARDRAQEQVWKLNTENMFWKDAANAKIKEVETLQQSLIEAHDKGDLLVAELLQSTKASSELLEEKELLETTRSEARRQVDEAKKTIEVLRLQLDASLRCKVEAENDLSSSQAELLVIRKRMEIASQDLELKTLELKNLQTVFLNLEEYFANIFHLAENALTSNVNSISCIHHLSLDVLAQYKGWNVDQSGLISSGDDRKQLKDTDQPGYFHHEMTGSSVLATPFSRFSVLGREKGFSESENQELKQLEDQYLMWKKRIEELHFFFRQEISKLQQNLDKLFEIVKLDWEAVGHHEEAETSENVHQDAVKLQENILELQSQITSKETALLSVLAEKEHLECTVSAFERALSEKDEQYSKLKDSLVNAENIMRDFAMKASTSESRILDLEKLVTKWENEYKLAHNKLQTAEENEAHFRSTREELASLQIVLSSKNKELERQALAILDAKEHMGVLTMQVKELEDIIEQKQMSVVNLEASRSKAAAKLTATLNRFSELWQQCEGLLAEVEKLHHSLEIRDNDLSQLKQENAKADSEIHSLQDMLESKNSEIFQLKSQLNEILIRLGAAESALSAPTETREKVLDVVASFTPTIDWKEVIKLIDNIKEEVRDSRAHAEKKEAIMQELKKKLEVVQGDKAILQSTLNSKQMQLENFQNQYVSHPQRVVSGIEAAPPAEIEEVGHRGKAALHPGSSHIRGLRKPLQVAVDVDTESVWPQLDIDDKGHAFKPLMTSRFIPKATHILAERLDGLCVGGGKLLMRQPIARLGLSLYWISIHLWLLIIVSTAKF
ncbi:hypothetical protein O6H91_16G034100 [Diphasiastrum complanatum]|nr:hypothetical protein O6H91_16G034100 [Diphasiastrum complanatum]